MTEQEFHNLAVAYLQEVENQDPLPVDIAAWFSSVEAGDAHMGQHEFDPYNFKLVRLRSNSIIDARVTDPSTMEYICGAMPGADNIFLTRTYTAAALRGMTTDPTETDEQRGGARLVDAASLFDVPDGWQVTPHVHVSKLRFKVAWILIGPTPT